MNLDPPILGYYGRGREQGRLFEQPPGILERLRTWNILRRLLPIGGRVLDIGGGAGVHAEWLAGRGYEVELFEPVPIHLEQARKLVESLPDEGRFVVEKADARAIPRPDGYADVVLLLGPLYHLVDSADRQQAISEARRLLRPDGHLVAAGISRYAWLMDAYRQQLATDPDVHETILYTLTTGKSNEDPGPESFLAYFHQPEELISEIETMGFQKASAHGVEGFAWLLPDLGAILAEESARERLMALLQEVEREPSMLGVSAHILCIARNRNGSA